jgi:hypothetical protein
VKARPRPKLRLTRSELLDLNSFIVEFKADPLVGPPFP